MHIWLEFHKGCRKVVLVLVLLFSTHYDGLDCCAQSLSFGGKGGAYSALYKQIFLAEKPVSLICSQDYDLPPAGATLHMGEIVE